MIISLRVSTTIEDIVMPKSKNTKKPSMIILSQSNWKPTTSMHFTIEAFVMKGPNNSTWLLLTFPK